MSKPKIYLDNAATTQVDEAVFEVMKPFFCDKFGNASSAHSFGREAREAVEKAREQVADFLGCGAKEIIFTSCATESNNLAIKGVVKKMVEIFRQTPVKDEARQGRQDKPHIITSAIEHHCVLNVCRNLEKDGIAEITYLPVYDDGVIRVEDVERVIKENTILVSIMYANNEIGTIQPIEEVGKMIKEYKGNPSIPRQMADRSGNKIYFHVDAVQATNYLDCNVDKLGVDLLSMSAHKFYGPKGVGALYIRKGTPITRMQDGGEQEFKLRAGTHNTAGIVGMGEAIKNIKNEQVPRQREQKSKIKNITELRDKLIKEVLSRVPNSKLNGSREKRLPNNANFSFPGAEGEAILLSLDMAGIAVSTGSACASENLNPSHVLTALGLGPEDSHSSIRMTLGKNTTEHDIDYVLDILPNIIEKLRKISGASVKKNKLPDDFGC